MKAASEILYIPAKVKNAVDAITQKPLVLITAGSGYGKTTAVVNCLGQIPRSTIYHWYTCFGELQERAWEGVCRLISYADARVGEYLSKLEKPTVNNMGYIASLMAEIACDRETILVIDNFQLAAFSAPYLLLNAMAAHGNKKLHIAVLSQPLYTNRGSNALDPRICHITQEVFCFSPQDAVKLFSLGAAALDEEQAARLCDATDGWVAALRLHMAELYAKGSLSENIGIGELMEHAFWSRLSETQQKLFLGLSLLDTFTEGQAARMLGRDVIADELWVTVKNNAFVRRSSNSYSLHSMLKSFLAAKLAVAPPAVQRRMFAHGGEACQLQGKNVEALRFFIEAGEDVRALSVPISSLQLAQLIRSDPDGLEKLLSRCQTEVLVGRFLFLLGTAVKASLNEKRTLARTAFLRLEQLSQAGGEANRRDAAAAFEMAASFRAYNDIEQMSRHHAAAISLLDDPQDFYVTNDSWTFCIPSVLYMFWREDAALATCVELLQKGIPNYSVLGGGKGLGWPEMMKAEALLFAGKLDESVSQCHLARTVAKRAGQDSLLFCAWTLLAKAALLRGDIAAFRFNLKEIERHAFEGKEFLCVTASEAALGGLYSLLAMEEKIPRWMLAPESVRETLYPGSAPFALIITLRHIRKHRPEELIGTAEGFIAEADSLHHLLPKLYFLLEEAVWYEQHDKRDMAAQKTGLALSLALPDKVILPFAEYYGDLSEVLRHDRLKNVSAGALERIQELGRQFVRGSAALRAALTGTSPLTPREREVALLAQKRVSTKEIAQSLSISPATVRNTLSKIYSKLAITNKTELSDKQF
ncbi:MAG: LuxR C-terminal-related transcriptional regulator [Oscillospiraceae bacterium]|nr:LuxR C-terminal-related transcriptional regulator [Oscillospiraceae bacterium]